MNLKVVTITIIISVLVATIVFFVFTNKKSQVEQIVRSPVQGTTVTTPSIPNPASLPLPTWEPITIDSNLSEEIKKIEIPSYTEAFKNLKDQISGF